MFTLLFLISFNFAYSDQSRLEEVANSRYWHLLLHYKKRWITGYKSEADGTNFFLSPEGKTDPLKELIADIEGFKKPAGFEVGDTKQHPQCAYPERYRFLKQELKFDIPEQDCTTFRNWKARFRPQSATLVFASSYLNNPASMFGHTFLKIDSKPPPAHQLKNDLLDYGLNYGADTGQDNGLVFAFRGLFGSYHGHFSLMPYFEKVNEYADAESRDMWEYKLNLSEEQVDRMINHFWELAITYFDYFFLEENCSYHLLAVLEVANPDWHLTDKFFTHVIPSDTIRVLKHYPGSIVDVRYRSSLYRQMRQKIIALNPKDVDDFERNRDADEVDLKGTESALALDALIDHQKYKVMKAKKELDEKGKERQRKLLVARAKHSADEYSLPEIRAENRPDQGSNSGKFSMYAGALRNSDYYGLQVRPAFHDLMDRDLGFLKFSQIDVLKGDFRYYRKERRPRLHQFTIADVISLVPVDRVNKSPSFTGGAGLYSPQDIECKNCTVFRGFGGGGVSFYLWPEKENFLLYTLLKGNFEYSGWFKYLLRIGPSLQTGILAEFLRYAKAGIDVEGVYYPFQYEGTQYHLKFTGRASLNLAENFEIRWISSYFLKPGLNTAPFFDHTGMFSWYF